MAEVENRIQHHVKSFWSFVNKAKKSTALPVYMYLRDRSADCRKITCNLIADHFKSVFHTDTLAMLSATDRSMGHGSSLFISMQIEHDELVSALRKLDDNFKSGPDEIPPYFLKDV